VFVLAPNQTPTIDAFTVEKLVGLKPDDPFQVTPGHRVTHEAHHRVTSG
jgi:hypothetical protein